MAFPRNGFVSVALELRSYLTVRIRIMTSPASRSQLLSASGTPQRLHDKVVGAAVVPNIVQRANVRMIELRDGARLAFEARLQVWAGHQRRVQDFDGNGAVKPGVARPIDVAHATGANRRDDLIGSQTGSRNQSHFSPLRKVCEL